MEWGGSEIRKQSETFYLMAQRKNKRNSSGIWIAMAVICYLMTGVLAYVFIISELSGHITVTEEFLQYGIIIGGTAFLGTVFLLAGTPEKKRPRAARFSMAILFGVYLIILAGLLFGGSRVWYAGRLDRKYSLKPFESIRLYMKAYEDRSLRIRVVASNLIGNILLFIPMTWFVPFLGKWARKWYLFLPAMLGLICLVELTQYLTGRGSLDIDDVILNYSGVILGFVFLWNPLMVKLWKKTKLIEKNG